MLQGCESAVLPVRVAVLMRRESEQRRVRLRQPSQTVRHSTHSTHSLRAAARATTGVASGACRAVSMGFHWAVVAQAVLRLLAATVTGS